MLGLGDMSRALEHDVLEEVGETGLARHLVLRADVVPEVHRDDRREMVLCDDDPQPVVEMVVAECDLGDGGRHEGPSSVRGGGAASGSVREILAPAPEFRAGRRPNPSRAEAP